MTKTSRKTTALSGKNNAPKGLTGKNLSVRAAAAQIILQVLDQGKSLSALIPETQLKLKPQDLPLLQEICFGICRVLPRLEWIIRLLMDKPLKGKTRIVHCLLLVGLYQILYTRIPQHAAINETVNAAKELKSDNFRGLLNGVLRRFLREQESVLATVDKHWQTNHPEWLVNKLKKIYPNWRDIIDANNRKPPMWLRVNRIHGSTENYRQLLAENDMTACTDENPHALRLESPMPVQRLPRFAEGWVTVQDVHAQWSGILLEPQNGELILDACAAPGGKTTHILEQAPQAKVVAVDVEENRLKRITENLARLNQQAIVICGDAARPETWLEQAAQQISGRKSAVQFDRILLDAPCSASGVIRRHPDIKWLRQEQDIAPLVDIQYQILTALWATLKPNGVLLYATCSVLPEENGRQIARFLAEHTDAQLMPLPFSPPQEIGHQFLPTENGGDGFYYAKLRKTAQ
ncbi:16S rRNA m5C967 methyltransferase [Actinobacillus succinogenes]|uniref:Ribosomal RNA small subunit methyltransferase B n=1 Tax=Actinobacillus succinogenes (strain ATCC 55618 / DSM 22257 / CCUG 43843 / 130Z) TaxID=339671 RepID=A6VKJ7_ACTSZ|nr:16S rRNA (cytosine(967)-C(5))-methyltransferase RsmB [Actinobacillus succinogenes]ABR73494.1 sun protein [Actinobacillus succinogenes 130Z]PHI40042.1 16S rRNA m5C967 methyltransferase [Actinobacillus succinogenes]